jgi:hypothetical protein
MATVGTSYGGVCQLHNSEYLRPALNAPRLDPGTEAYANDQRRKAKTKARNRRKGKGQ